jgi:hypothetical protein
MRRRWRVHRQVRPSREGTLRWDQAYRLLLSWTTDHPPDLPGPLLITTYKKEEDGDACGHLCPCLDDEPDPGADH